MVLEKTLESPLDCKEIQPVHPKGNQSWILIGRTDVEAETPILWPPDAKSWLIWKDPDAGKDWGQEDKGMTGWDGWMASLTRWMWVWVNSGSSWWTGRPGVLQSMGSQRVRHSWATELNWTCGCCDCIMLYNHIQHIRWRRTFIFYEVHHFIINELILLWVIWITLLEHSKRDKKKLKTFFK